MSSDSTGINFSNDLPYDEEFNTYTYRNFYNGGGVALGDINNDGLVDIYFTGNIVENKLYLNKGNFRFEDITESAGVACKDVWSTGANIVDINGDGLLDIYVCKAGKPGGANRHNELFINKGDLTFEESSMQYGLDIEGLSIHSAFFDYDKDGDLDCYILNNSIRSICGFDLKSGLRNIPDEEGNKFMRNDGGRFVDVSQETGFYTSNIGYGLGITLFDFNQDNWTDIFISNDFFERDYLYINNQDGTFSEVGDQYFQSMSMGSMGADAADIDNDLLPDLFVTEMLPTNLERKKTKTQYENWDKYSEAVRNGYHHQYGRNVLQRNLGEGIFTEVSRYSGVDASEWSWAALIQDFDNDGLKDLFVSNGIYKDLLDKDYLNFFANENVVSAKIKSSDKLLTNLIDSLESKPVPNHMYRNKGNFQFENVSDNWGLDTPSFSNGSAYGDLDNDGDLDLVVNNANMPAFIYQNNTDTAYNYFQITLRGEGLNTQALGAKVYLFHQGGSQYLEHYTAKGFQSTVDTRMHFGLGKVSKIDSVVIVWPNNLKTCLVNPSTNQHTLVYQKDATLQYEGFKDWSTNDMDCRFDIIDYKHSEVNTNLFARERMVAEMKGYEGPIIKTEDINGDGKKDVLIGGGKGQKSKIFISEGKAYRASYLDDENQQVVAMELADIDNDGDFDLYCGHGGKTFSQFNSILDDVIYTNDGRGNFEKKDFKIKWPYPMYTGTVSSVEINGDDFIDFIVCEKMKIQTYGEPCNCYTLQNLNGNGFEIAEDKLPSSQWMTYKSEKVDLDNNGFQDIVKAGEWSPIEIWYNNGRIVEAIEIPNSKGLWTALRTMDIDLDGDMDIIAGNVGKNNHYRPRMRMYIHDFDGNGSKEQLICQIVNGKYYPIHDADEMYSQWPLLKKRFLYYSKLAKADINELFGDETIKQATYYELDMTESCIFINNGNKNFDRVSLPEEVQYSCVHAIASVKSENRNYLLIGGNDYRVKPQFGRQDGSLGWSIEYDIQDKGPIFAKPKPLDINGQIRSIESIEEMLIFGINDDKIKVCEKSFVH